MVWAQSLVLTSRRVGSLVRMLTPRRMWSIPGNGPSVRTASRRSVEEHPADHSSNQDESEYEHPDAQLRPWHANVLVIAMAVEQVTRTAVIKEGHPTISFR